MRFFQAALCVACVCFAGAAASAQDLTPVLHASIASASLPDAPSARLLAPTEASASSSLVDLTEDDQAAAAAPIAKKYARTIKPGQAAQPLTAGDKILMSLRSQVSLFSIVGPLVSAGISQANDSRPHYGTDAAAFGERFGAAEARNASLSIFSTGILASALREDPRYYIYGHDHPFFKRVVYAATRVAVTRTDGGSATPNLQLIGGVFGANALTTVYYPSADTDTSRIVTRSLVSLATRMGTNQLREFGAEIRSHIPFRKK